MTTFQRKSINVIGNIGNKKLVERGTQLKVSTKITK